MEIISLKDNLNFSEKGKSLAIGNFDGVHLGHKEIVEQTIKAAKSNDLFSAALTFEPHPISLFNPEAKNYRLTTKQDKIKKLQKLGLDFCIVINFNSEFSEVGADLFIENILSSQLNAKYIFTGKDFIFGHNRSGNSHLLEVKSGKFDYEYKAISDVSDNNGIRYSSSRVRELLKNGKLESANKIMDSNFTISGMVVSGRKEGREIGFPTANLELNEYVIPKYGVYAASVKVEGCTQSFIAAVNIGVRPSFDNGNPLLEAHILDFNDDVYGKTINVELLKFIRNERKFNSVDAVREQIDKDIKIIRGVNLG